MKCIIMMLLYEAIKDESAELCFVFHNVLDFPLENEIVLHIRYNKLIKVLLTLVHCGKILHADVVSRQV